jgi:hypothetical protein
VRVGLWGFGSCDLIFMCGFWWFMILIIRF